MSTYSSRYDQVSLPVFRERVQMAIVDVALEKQASAATVFAYNILTDPKSYLDRFCFAVANEIAWASRNDEAAIKSTIESIWSHMEDGQ